MAHLGDLPTPVEARPDLARAAAERTSLLFVKRDDRTSPIYGGNKVRTLEVLFGEALERGAREIYSTGAYGSNHAVATVLHAPRVGLTPGALLFPQPESVVASENLGVVLSRGAAVGALRHWSTLPFGMWRLGRRRGARAFVMVPGGATPRGALGYIEAALELGQQVASGALPCPRTIIVGVGSTCTTAGLLAGIRLAARRGLGFVDAEGRPAPPQVLAVRVTPWPVTSRYRIVSLAVRASALLARLARDATLHLESRDVHGLLRLDGRFLGPGYGYPTASGLSAMEMFRAHGGPSLDTTYSAKSAAGLMAYLRSGADGPVVYWATKSTAPLPAARGLSTDAPPAMARWLNRCPP